MRAVEPDSQETQGLLQQIRAGDRRAVEQLFARHQTYLHRLVELRLDPKLRSRLNNRARFGCTWKKPVFPALSLARVQCCIIAHGYLDVSDVVQEAHLEALNRLDAYLDHPALPFRLWLRQIAFDRALKARRHHLGTARRALEREVPLPEQSSLVLARQLLACGSTPSQQLDHRELALRVRQAVAQLPEADREVVMMRHFEGLSNQEVACLLGIEPATASKRHGRAMLRLHRILFEGGMTESQL